MPYDPFAKPLLRAELKDAAMTFGGQGLTRTQLLDLAMYLRQEDHLYEAFHAAPSPVDQNTILMVHQWVKAGAQSVVMPDTYAAALMATDAKDALEGQHMPWPAFEIRVPQKTLYSSHAEVLSVYVSEIPKDMERTGKYAHHNLSVCYMDEASWGVNTYASLPGMFDKEVAARSGAPEMQGTMPEWMHEIYDQDQERRLWAMITRLVAGVVLAINQVREVTPGAFRALPLRVKHNTLKPNSAPLGKPMKIDCRPTVRDFVLGTRPGGPQTVQTLVRGHWRQQAYGERWKKRRTQWIMPFLRGDGPLVMRATRLGFDAEKPE